MDSSYPMAFSTRTPSTSSHRLLSRACAARTSLAVAMPGGGSMRIRSTGMGPNLANRSASVILRERRFVCRLRTVAIVKLPRNKSPENRGPHASSYRATNDSHTSDVQGSDLPLELRRNRERALFGDLFAERPAAVRAFGEVGRSLTAAMRTFKRHRTHSQARQRSAGHADHDEQQHGQQRPADDGDEPE